MKLVFILRVNSQNGPVSKRKKTGVLTFTPSYHFHRHCMRLCFVFFVFICLYICLCYSSGCASISFATIMAQFPFATI